MGWLRHSLRRLRDGSAATIGLAFVVAVTAFVFGVAPGLFHRTATGILRSQVAAVPVEVRSIQVIEERRIAGVDAAPLAAVDETGAGLEARFPAGVGDLAPDRAVVVDTPRWSIVSPTRYPATARFRVQPGADARIGITAGAAPTGRTRQIAAPPASGADPGSMLTVVEGILPRAAAETIGARVGDTLILRLDRSDRLASRLSGALAFDLVGTFDALDPGDEGWFADPSAFGSVVREVGPNTAFEDVTALVAPAAYPALYEATRASNVPFRYTWRFQVDPGLVDADRLDAAIDDLRRLETIFPTVSVNQGPQPKPSLRGGLLGVLLQFASRWRSATAVIAVVALGPAMVALLALALVVLLVAQRRRFAVTLAASRGASSRQLAASVAAEGLLVALPAALVGTVLAVAVTPSDGSVTTVAVAAFVAVLVAVLFVTASRPAFAGTGPAGGAARESGLRRVAPRRLAMEALVVLIAGVGALLLRDRGGVAVAEGSRIPSLDMFTVAVPALLGIAGGILAMRIYPLPMRVLAWLAGLRSDLVPSLALRRITRSGGSGPVLAVLLATATVAAFASATLVHLDRAAVAAGWQEVGAPFLVRAEAGDATGTAVGTIVPLPTGFDAAALPGVEAAAPAYQVVAQLFPQGTRVDFLAVDAPAYERVTGGTPAAPELPQEMLAGADGAIPAIVSADLPIGHAAPKVGDRFQVSVLSGARDCRVVAVRPTFPSVAPGSRFVVVPLAALQAEVTGLTVAPTEVFVRAPDGDLANLRPAVLASGHGLVIVSRAAVTATFAGSPYVGAVSAGVAAAAIVAALYAALAVAAALALTGSARANEVGQLRTLGLARRDVVALAAFEHGPTVAAAFAGGMLLGFGIFIVTQPALGLADLVGSRVDVPLTLEPGYLALILGSMIAIAVVGIGLAASLQGRAALALAVRRNVQ